MNTMKKYENEARVTKKKNKKNRITKKYVSSQPQ